LEPDRGTGKVGKPGRPVWFAPGAGLSVAVVITSGGVRSAAITARGEILRESAAALDTSQLDADALLTIAREQVSAVSGDGQVPLGIGVSVPGICAADGTVLGSGQVPATVGTRLRDELGRGFDLSVMVDNDARAQAL